MTKLRTIFESIFAAWPILLYILAAFLLALIFIQPAAQNRAEKLSLPGTAQTPVEFSSWLGRDGNVHHAVSMKVANPKRWKKARELQFLIATYGQNGVATHSIEFANGRRTCLFRSRQSLDDNRYLKLDNFGCRAAVGHKMTLKIVTAPGVRLALWAHPATNKRDRKQAAWLMSRGDVLLVPNSKAMRKTASAALVDRGEVYDLLWETRAGQWFLFGSLMVIFAGMFLQRDAKEPFFAMGIGVLCLGLGFMYAVASPPLQAPDEADHVLAYGKMHDIPGWRGDTLALAEKGHYQRMLCHVDETFAVADLTRTPKKKQKWPQHVMDVDSQKRSVIGHWFWQRLVPDVQYPRSIGAEILNVRLANAGVLGFAVLVAGLLAWRFRRHGFGILVGFLLVPTLLFFGTHVSNYVFVVAAVLVASVLVIRLTVESPSPAWHGMLGLVLAGFVLSSRAAFLFLPFAFAIVFCRLVADTWQKESGAAFSAHRRSIVSAQLALLPSALAVFFLADTRFLARVAGDAQTSTPIIVAGAVAALILPVAVVLLCGGCKVSVRRWEGKSNGSGGLVGPCSSVSVSRWYGHSINLPRGRRISRVSVAMCRRFTTA